MSFTLFVKFSNWRMVVFQLCAFYYATDTLHQPDESLAETLVSEDRGACAAQRLSGAVEPQPRDQGHPHQEPVDHGSGLVGSPSMSQNTEANALSSYAAFARLAQSWRNSDHRKHSRGMAQTYKQHSCR